MARFSLGQAINTTYKGITFQSAAAGLMWVPDIHWPAIRAMLLSGNFTISTEDYDEAYVKVTNSVVQSVNDASATDMTWDTETVDPRGFHSTGANTERLTVPTSYEGFYEGGCGIVYPSDVDGYRRIAVLKNGVTLNSQNQSSGGAAMPDLGQTISFGEYLVAGDFITIQIKHTSGAAINVTKNAFWMTRTSR